MFLQEKFLLKSFDKVNVKYITLVFLYEINLIQIKDKGFFF